MNIYVLNQEIERLGIVDIYESFIWNTSYNGIGSFELRCSLQFFDLLQTERLVQNSDDDNHVGLIEYITKVQDENGTESLSVKGRMIEALLERRTVLGQQAYSDMRPHEIVVNLLNSNILEPEDENRKIPDFKINIHEDVKLEPLISYASSNAQLLPEISGILQESLLGFNIKADNEDKKYVFEVYKGVNRTEEDNTQSEVHVNSTQNSLNNGEFINGSAGWTSVNGGTNYQDNQVLSVVSGGTMGRRFRKRKLRGRYAVYRDDDSFQKWEYYWMNAGYYYQNVNLNPDHIYYISILCENPAGVVLGYGIMKDDNTSTIMASQSGKYDVLYVPEKSGSHKFVMAVGELPEKDVSAYTDYGLMIDLTATFGAGREPSLSWCSDNIYYENGWKYRIEIISLIPNANDPLVFSRDRDNLIEVDYTKNIVNECTVLYVQGQEAQISVISGNDIGLSRKERFIDVSSEIPRTINDITIPEASYLEMLESKGRATLRKLVVSELIDAKFYLLSPKKFRQDYNLGDIITCLDNKIGFEANLRISEATEVWDLNGYSLSVTLGDDIPDLQETMRLISKGAK